MCLHGVKVTPSVMTEAAPELVYTGFPSLHDCCGGDDICNNAAVMTKGLAFLHIHDGLSAALDVTDNGAFDCLPVRLSVQLWYTVLHSLVFMISFAKCLPRLNVSSPSLIRFRTLLP